MLKLGITGGIASGKSTAADFFEKKVLIYSMLTENQKDI